MQIDLFKWGLALETDEGEVKAQTHIDRTGFNVFVPYSKSDGAFMLTIGRPLSLNHIVRVFVNKERVSLCVLGFGISIAW